MKRIRKIVITGPESSGKTTLAESLSAHFGEPLVPEYARIYIDDLSREYELTDLDIIAHGQLQYETKLLKEANKYLICDTDLITIKIWSEVKYESCSIYIIDQIEKRYYDLYLLCKPDIPWAPDPQREHPGQRAMLYERYQNELKFYGKQFIEISGDREERLKKAIFYISSINP